MIRVELARSVADEELEEPLVVLAASLRTALGNFFPFGKIEWEKLRVGRHVSFLISRTFDALGRPSRIIAVIEDGDHGADASVRILGLTYRFLCYGEDPCGLQRIENSKRGN